MTVARVQFRDAVISPTGDVLVATVEVRNPGTAVPITETIYADASGDHFLSNPFPTDLTGRFQFYLTLPKRVDLLIQAVGYAPYTVKDVDVIGIVTENMGATVGTTDGGLIPHGLSGTPTAAVLTPTVANEFASITGKDGVNLTVAIKKHDGTPGTAQNIYWRAWL